MSFEEDLRALGFRAVEQRRGVLQYALRSTPYLTYWVHWEPDDHSVLFTWELALGEYLAKRGLQLGSNEELNTFLFPQHDARGPDETTFVVGEMERVEQLLGSLNFVSPDD
jgi:hypothetical protein